MAERKREKPPKPYAKFPLFAHRNGCWVKTIAGAHKAFGPWRWPDRDEYERSWRDALERFHQYEEAAARGQLFLANPRGIDIKTICDGYLTAQHEKAESLKIKGRTFAERRETITQFRDAVGAATTVGELEQNPLVIREFVAEFEKRLGFHRYNNSIQRLRSMWRWAAHPNDGVLGGVAFRWIDLFKKREIREFRRQRRREREAGVLLTFAPDEVRALIDHATGSMKAIVMLGYFAGYGNTDLGEMPDTALSEFVEDERIYLHGRHEIIPKGWGKLYFPRPKTELDRWAIVPPSVVRALKDARALRPRPQKKENAGKLFLTAGGRKVCYEIIHRDEAGLIHRVTVTDNIAQNWDRLIARIGRCSEHGWQVRKLFTRDKNDDGSRKLSCPACGHAMKPMQPRGFYCLRHTATTRAATSGASSDTRNLFEGHTSGSDSVRQTFYLDPSHLHDLLLIARDLAAAVGLSGNCETPTPPVVAAASPADVAA